MVGGGMAAIITLPASIVCGLLAFAPLGPEYTSAGVLAGITGAIVTGILASLFGGSPLQISGPRSSLAIVMGNVLVGFTPILAVIEDATQRAALMLGLMFACVFLAGIFQVLLGMLRLGSVVKYVPHAVLAGLMNGFALIIIISQLPVLFGVDRLSSILDFSSINPMIVGVSALTIGTTVFVRRFFKSVPGSLVGLVVGGLAYHQMMNTADLVTIGALPVDAFLNLPFAVMALPDATSIDYTRILPIIIGSSITLAFLGSILSLLSASALDSLSRNRNDGSRELIGQGIANMASSAFGGLAGAGAPARSRANFEAGGRTRMAGIFHGLIILAILLGLGPLVAHIPMVVISSLLVLMAARLVDHQSLRQVIELSKRDRSADYQYTLPNLLITVLVTILTVTIDFVVAAGIGLVSASLMFAMRMEKVVVRGTHRGDLVHSKTSRPQNAEDVLEKFGHRIMVFEAQGPIFFGSADQLSREIELQLASLDIAILDLRRVAEIDDTGLHILRQLDQEIMAQGKSFLLSYLGKGSPLWAPVTSQASDWQALGVRTFLDTDSALSHAEDQLLSNALVDQQWTRELSLNEADLLKGLSPVQLEQLSKLLEKCTYEEGDYILTQGEDTHDIYILAAGTASVTMRVVGSKRDVRLSNLRPGVTFGEMGMIDEAPRSTNVIADCTVVCYRLNKSTYDTMDVEHPDILSKLLLNMTREISGRLRITSQQVSDLEQ